MLGAEMNANDDQGSIGRQASAIMERCLRTVCNLRLLSVLVLWALPGVVKAQAYTNNYGIWTYTSTDGTNTITGYTGPGGAVAIPTSINSLPVTGIGNGFQVFQGGQPNITSIAIPSSVTLIIGGAMGNCEGLLAINVDPSNPSYSSLDGVLFDKAQTDLIQFPAAKAGSYTIPAGVTDIDYNALKGCTGLVSVVIPSTVSIIDLEAFAGCSVLTNVFFLGNAPDDADPTGSVFAGDSNATVYYLPGTTGWDWHPLGGPPVGYPDYEYLPAVLWNPRAQPPAVRSGQFGFNITGSSNLVVVIQARTNLANPTWLPLQTNTLNGSSLHFSDSQWTNYGSRFYRVRWP